MRKRYMLGLAMLQLALVSTAQEFNIGAHINPTITTAFKGASVYDKGLRLSPAHIDFNLGADVNVSFNKFRIETGVNVVNKSLALTRQILNFSSMSYAKDVFRSSSIEVPVLIGYKLLTRQSKTYYHLYGVAGASYELAIPGSISQRTGVQGNGEGSVFNHVAQSPSTAQNFVNVVAGLHVNAIVKRIGLIDYGFTWHIPLQNSGPYLLHSSFTSTSAGNTIDYKSTMYPRMAYINLKLCYYFLNLDRTMHAKKYSRL